MGGGGGDGGAAQARADEQARQERIRQGTENINTIFDGYDKTYGDGLVDPSAYQNGNTYYTDDGSEYVYNTPTRASANTAPGQLYSGKKTDHVNGQFSDDFFNNRKQSYLDYANPQLNDQYTDAQKQLTYALDRNGMLDSSVRAQKEADLQKLYDTNRRAVADQGLTYENQSRSNVEDARANLISTLNATGDAEGAAQSATSRAAALSQADSYSPLGQLFSTFTSGLGQQAALERAAALSGGAITPTFNTGLFGGKKTAVQVTN